MLKLYFKVATTLLITTFFNLSEAKRSLTLLATSNRFSPISATLVMGLMGTHGERGGGEDGLRLDTEPGAFADLGGYQEAIVAGNLDSSEMITRITSDDPDIVMPPSEHSKSLTKSEVELLKSWVSQGAKWSLHWSYRPLDRSVKREEIGSTN